MRRNRDVGRGRARSCALARDRPRSCAVGSGLLALLLLPLLAGPGPRAATGAASTALAIALPAAASSAACRVPPDYYSFELHPTGTTPSARGATGNVEVGLVDSPFDLALSAEGRFERRVTVRVEGVRTAPGETLVAWAAPPDLTPLVRLGSFEPGEETASGVVDFNKFLVFVTIEPSDERAAEPSDERAADEPSVERWTGPIVLRGMSRSGRLQSMASHGMFETEPC